MPYIISIILTVIFTLFIKHYLDQPLILSYLLALIWGTYFGSTIFLHKQSRKDYNFKLSNILNAFLVTFTFILRGEWFYRFLDEFTSKYPNEYEKYKVFLTPYFNYLFLLIWGLALNSYSLGRLDSYFKNNDIKIKVKHILIGIASILFSILLSGIE